MSSAHEGPSSSQPGLGGHGHGLKSAVCGPSLPSPMVTNPQQTRADWKSLSNPCETWVGKSIDTEHSTGKSQM